MQSESMSRYARQTVLPQIGDAGQRQLLASRVAIIGCGATGTVIANHLARAGVGYLRIIDRDWVEWNNLQRQLLFDEADARDGSPKALAAAQRLQSVNSEIRIEPAVTDVSAANVEKLIGDCDLVMDGTDNFETRYVVNDACVKLRKPWVYTGAVATYGMSLLIRPEHTACLRCAFPEPPPVGASATCDTAGVLGPAVSVVASISSTEAIKWLVGDLEALSGKLIHVDVWDFAWHAFRVERKEDCPCCVRREFPFLQAAGGSHATSLCGRNAIQISLASGGDLDLPHLASRLASVGSVTHNRFLLKLDLGEFQLTVFKDGRTIVHGTTDEALARSLVSRYVGL